MQAVISDSLLRIMKNNNKKDFSPFSIRKMCITMLFGKDKSYTWIIPLILSLLLSILFISEWNNTDNQKLVSNCNKIESALQIQNGKTSQFYFQKMTCKYTKTNYFINLYTELITSGISKEEIDGVIISLETETEDELIAELYKIIKPLADDLLTNGILQNDEFNEITSNLLTLSMIQETAKTGMYAEFALNILYYFVILFAILRISGSIYRIIQKTRA